MIYALLSSVVYDNGVFKDYLGDLFMRCNQGNNSTGQFFTPYHISQFMAKATIGDEVITKAENDGILTVCDPCCGAGGLMLAALDVLKNDYNINYARNCFIECSDIDIRCVHMTYLQLSLAGVPAIIKHQNSLSRELWSVWKTPAFVFQYHRFYQYENYN
jgi:type I restriction-modification system DNA methylase subunit